MLFQNDRPIRSSVVIFVSYCIPETIFKSVLFDLVVPDVAGPFSKIMLRMPIRTYVSCARSRTINGASVPYE